jgi:uncharacterized protein YbaP (TraB family)
MPLIRSIAVVLGLVALSAPSTAAPAIWKVSDADSAIWLFGSVHMLKAETEWRTPLLNKLISKADRIYFEADISAAAQAEILPYSIEVGFNKNGELLSDQIGSALTERVRKAAAEYDIPMPSLLIMKPWLAATTLSSGPLLQSGFEAAYGVEMILAEELPVDRKAFLETGVEQLGFLSGGTMDEQITMLEGTLDTLSSARTDIETMVEAWLNGDPETLGHVFDQQMTGFEEAMVERIIDTRNQNWADQIEQMLAADEAILLVVGAAHLAGDASVVEILEREGYSSERLQ